MWAKRHASLSFPAKYCFVSGAILKVKVFVCLLKTIGLNEKQSFDRTKGSTFDCRWIWVAKQIFSGLSSKLHADPHRNELTRASQRVTTEPHANRRGAFVFSRSSVSVVRRLRE